MIEYCLDTFYSIKNLEKRTFKCRGDESDVRRRSQGVKTLKGSMKNFQIRPINVVCSLDVTKENIVLYTKHAQWDAS